MENINLIEDPDDAIIINEMSGLTIDEHEVHNCPKAKDIRVDRTDNGFQEKSEDISSDDGNEDPAGDDDERVIESVFHQLSINHNEDETSQAEKDPDAYVAYASKGPMVQKRSRANANATTAPYRKQNHNTDKNSASSSREKVEINKGNKMSHTLSHKTDVNATSEEQYNIGHFVDVASFLPELAQNNTSQTSSPKQQTEHKICGTNGKPGIPSLPDTSPAINNGTTLALPRVVIYKNPTTLWVSIPQVGIIVHPKLRKMGLQLPQISMYDNAPIEVGKTENYEIFIQLDNIRAIRLSTPAVISQTESKYCINIPNQFIELRPFSGAKGNSGIESLLEDVTETQIEEAISLVNGKDMTDLLKTYGPNEDSMLMHLCCKREEPPVIRAQVFALVSRILAQTNPNTRANVIQKNASGLSALDYTTVTNNRRLATFLADLYYMMGEDPTCPDISGNTLLHMLARKGDASADTLQALIALRYSEDGHEKERGPYSTSVVNLKRFMPIHHAVMSRSCPRHVIETLYRDMPSCLTAQTDNGSLPIHLACQYSSDRTMIALLLHYNRDVINAKRSDGFTPLHLVASRNDGPGDTSIGLIPLDAETQRILIYDLLECGADKTACVGDKYIPYDLVKVDRKIVRALLKTPERRVNEPDSYKGHQTKATNDDSQQYSSDKNASRNGVNSRTTTSIHHPPNHLELKQTNPLGKEDNENNVFSNSLIMVDIVESTDNTGDVIVSGSLNTNASTTSGQSHGSPADHPNRPPSSASSFLSTLSPTSSVVMGRDDPFICGGTTPSYTDSFNIGVDNNGSPISNGGGSQQQSPQSVVNHPFYSLYNCPSEGFGRSSRTSLSHPNSISSAVAHVSTFYNCYDSLSDSDGERVGTGDSGNESPSADNPSYSRCIIQEPFGQQPSRTPGEDADNCDVDVIAAQLYSHPTIQAVMNNADSTNVRNGGVRLVMLQNDL